MDKIQTDFNHYQHHNNDLRLQLLQKKKKLENIGSSTNDLSVHLGCLGAKVSVNQKTLQKQLVAFDDFEKGLEELVNESITGFQSRVSSVIELLNEMFREIKEMEANQGNIYQSLQGLELTRDAFQISFNYFTSQRADLQGLHAECCQDLQVQAKTNV